MQIMDIVTVRKTDTQPSDVEIAKLTDTYSDICSGRVAGGSLRTDSFQRSLGCIAWSVSRPERLASCLFSTRSCATVCF